MMAAVLGALGARAARRRPRWTSGPAMGGQRVQPHASTAVDAGPCTFATPQRGETRGLRQLSSSSQSGSPFR